MVNGVVRVPKAITPDQINAALDALGFAPGTVMELHIPTAWGHLVKAVVLLVDEETGKPYLDGEGEPAAAQVCIPIGHRQDKDGVS